MKQLIIIAMLLLTGCATTPMNTATSQPYRTTSGEHYIISGKSTADHHRIQILFDNTVVVDGRTSPTDSSGEFSSQYQGHDVSVSCFYMQKGTEAQYRCQVHVDGELAANLDF